MSARHLFGISLGVLLAIAPAASAQPALTAGIAPAAASAPALEPGLVLERPATPVAPAPRAMKVTAGPESAFDPQVPPPPPAPPAVPKGMKVVKGSESTGDPQAPPAPPVPPVPPVPAAAPRVLAQPTIPAVKGQLANVKVEFTITDQLGTRPPTRKTMTMTVADRDSGRIRTTTEFAQVSSKAWRMQTAPLSVDVFPTIEGNKIRLEFSLEYNLYQDRDANAPEDAPGAKTSVSERLSAVLDNGVPLVVAQSSDALTDRRLTVEVKAAILK